MSDTAKRHEFVDRPESLKDSVILGHALPREQRRRPRVTSFRVDAVFALARFMGGEIGARRSSVHLSRSDRSQLRRLCHLQVFYNKLGFADPYGSTSRAVDALFTRGRRETRDGLVVVRVGQSSPLLRETIDVLGRGECGTGKTAPDPLLDWVFAGTDGQSLCKPLDRDPDAYRVAWFR